MEGTKLKVGDEVLVKGYIVDVDPDEDILKYKISLHNCDYINNNWVARSSVVESNNDWELAARVAALPMSDFNDIFGEATLFDIFNEMSPVDVKQELDLYEQSKLQMGDLVEIKCEGCVWRGIFVGDNGDDYYYILIPGYKCVQRFRQSTHIITKLEHGVIDILRTLDNIKELPEESEDKR